MRVARAALALLCVALLCVSFLVGGSAASPTPQSICSVCGDHFERAARSSGVPVAVEAGDLEIRIDDDGDGHWTARTRINESGVRAFSSEPALLDDVVREALDGYGSTVDDPRDVTARLDGSTVVVTFTVRDMAHRGFDGILLVDYFHAGGNERHYVQDVPVTIRGPPGTVVTNHPDGATVDGATATWSGAGYDRELDDETYVAFGPSAGLGSTLATRVTIASGSAPFVVDHLVAASLVPGLLLAGIVALFVRIGGRFDGRYPGRGLALVGSGIALAVVALTAVTHGSSPVGGFTSLPLVAGVAYAGLGLLVFRYGSTLDLRQLTGGAVASVLAAVVLVSGTVGRPPDSLFGALTPVCLALPLVLFLPLGYATRRGKRARWWIELAMIAAVPLAVLPRVPIGGFGPAFYAVLLIPWVLGTGIFGAFLYWLGRGIAGDGEPGKPGQARDAGEASGAS